MATMRMPCAGGSSVTETLLWTNPSPTSDFAYQTTNLTGGKLSDFEELKIVYKIDKSSALNVHYAKFDLGAFIGSSNENRVGIAGQDSAATFNRMLVYDSDTTIFWGNSLQVYGTGTYNNKLIPLYIYGVNY